MNWRKMGLISVFVLLLCPSVGVSATLTWDGDGAAPWGGGGTWNTTLTDWWNGSAYQAWNNSAGDDAVFDTVGGTVTLASQMTAGSLTFNVGGYTLASSGIKLVGTAPTISVAADATATISFGVSGSSGLKKTGAGLLVMNSSPAYTGATTIADGVLRTWSVGTNNINLAGGVLELSASSLNTNLGTGSSQLQFTGSGGFSAYSTSYNYFTSQVRINNGAALTWGSGGFVPDGSELIFGSAWANGTVELANSINLGGSVRTIRVINGSADVDAAVDGPLTGTGGLYKAGGGTLRLNSANSYTGPTIVGGGVLQLNNTMALPGGMGATGGTSNLNMAGGAIEIFPTGWYPGLPQQCVFSRSLGTGSDQVQFTGSGGFLVNDPSAAGFYQAVYGVNLGGDWRPLAWGSGGFVPDGSTLTLGSNMFGVILDFQNALDLGASNRSICVPNGVARMSGALTGSGGIVKTGAGVLELGSASSYSGPTVIGGGFVRLSDTQAFAHSASNLVIAGGVVDLNGADFLAPLGTGPGQVQFTDSGGFSGYSPINHPSAASLVRVVNLGGQSAQVTWGSGGFVPDGATFVLGLPSVDGVPFMGFDNGTTSLDFQNPIDLGNSQRNIQAGYTDDWIDFLFNVQTLSGSLSGNGGVVKSGRGVLRLAAANTYSGETKVVSGILELADPLALPGGIGPTGGTSHLLVTGGARIRLSAGTFQRNLGSGPDGVQFSGSGGFSGGSTPVVNLGGASAPVVWDNNPYLPDDFVLVLENPGSIAPVDFQNALILGAGKRTVSTFYGSGDTHGRLSGSISGVGGLKKDGGLVLELTAANSYSGETEVYAGILRLSHPGALPGGTGATGGTSNLHFTGSNSYSDMNGISVPLSYYYSSGSDCVVELAAGDFTRSLGTGPSQVQFTASGGFSAYGANRIVNLGGASQSVTWGANSFVPTNYRLCLSSQFSNATVDFQNPIDFGSAVREVYVPDGSAAVDAKLSGTLYGTGGLQKSGEGTLALTAANTYTGQTQVRRGTLRLSNAQALPGGTGVAGGLSNLAFTSGGGGVVELAAGNFLRGLGTGPTQVQFSYSSGGFAAVGADRIVNLGGNSAPITWGQSNFAVFTFTLGSKSANAMVDFQNPMDFGSSWAELQIDRGSAPIDARMSGRLSGTFNIDKNGDGTLQLTANNTFSGKITLWGGKLLVDGALSPSSTVVVNGSATLGGTGSVGNVEVTEGGTIAPGESAGILSLAGNLTVDAGALLDFDLDAAASSDRIAMSSSILTLNDQKFADFDFHALAGFGEGTYVLIDAGTVQGSLNAADSGTIDGMPATLSVSGGDLVLTVVPEPPSLVLMAIGALGLFGVVRRRRRNSER